MERLQKNQQQRLKNMEIQTIQKYMHTSPRKLRLVADMVRKMSPSQALAVLKVTPKYAAKDLKKAIETVLANGRNAGLKEEAIFKVLEINESTKMRRFHAGTRGRVKPFKRRMAHIKIVVTDDLSNKVQATSNKLKQKEGGKQTEVVVDKSAEKAE